MVPHLWVLQHVERHEWFHPLSLPSPQEQNEEIAKLKSMSSSNFPYTSILSTLINHVFIKNKIYTKEKAQNWEKLKKIWRVVSFTLCLKKLVYLLVAGSSEVSPVLP